MAQKEETRIFNGGMNKDDSPLFLPNGDWIDALNASVLNREGTGGDIVTEIGNEEISLYRSSGATTYSLPSGTNTTIGSVDDPVRGHTYWFVHNSNNNHVILRYEYDTNIARLVWEDNSFDQAYNPYNGDYQGAYSSTTTYSKEEIVSNSGSFYRMFRENYKVECVITAAATNTLTIGTHYYKTGDLIRYNDNGGSVGGLTDGDYYFVIRASSTTIQLADTFVDALNSTNVTFAGGVTGLPSVDDPKSLTNTSVWINISNTLNFSSSFDINHALITENSGRVYLLWTDNNEQPSIMEVTSGYPTTTQYPYLERRFLDLYAFQPQHPPTASYGSDSIVDQNNTALKALQFRYAWKLKDGRTTVMSPISRIPMPTVSSYGDIQDDNKVVMQIPIYHGESNNFIDEVYLYVKTNGDNNTGDWYLAETFDVSEETIVENPSPYADRYLWYISYDFFNTSTLAPVPSNIQTQIQDFVPLKSATMAQSGNGRVLLGNNVDGFDFDTNTLDVTLTAIVQNTGLSTTDPPEAGFKKTCRYPIGIVYGDRNGRLSTVYTNEAMVFKAPYWSSSNQGSVQCQMNVGHAPPDWAEFWMPVYGGNQTMEYWTQSAIANASSPNLLLKDILDYTSTRTDTGYNYTFQQDQRLRVIYDESASGFMASTNGDVSVLKNAAFVLTIPFGDFSTAPNNHDMVEVYRLKQAIEDTDEVIWYEMGWAFKIEVDQNGNKVHGGTNSFTNNLAECQSQIIGGGIDQDCIVVLDQADCYVRYMDDVETTASTFKSVEFKDLFPFKESDIDTIGRPNVFNQDFKQTRREQEIVFSEPLVDNTDFFGINRFFDVSFNDSLNNDYGELTVMHSDGNELFCIQETKVARMLANKNFIYTGDLQSIDIQSNVFLSKPQYFPQDFGCQNPESFADYGGVKFWVDRLKGAVLMSAGDEVKNIAQNKMSNYFESNLPYPYPYNDNADGNNNKIYGGYSIRDNSYYLSLDAHKTIKRIIDSSNDPEYVVTMTDLDIADGTFDRIVDFGTMPIKRIVGSNYDTPLFGMTVTASDSSAKTITIDVGASLGYLSAVEIYVPYVDTLSFSLDRGRWISKHSFNPEWIGSSANSIITFKSGKAYVHQLATYETAFFSTNFNFARFYGTTYNTFIEFPFNQELNIVKEPITIATDSNQVFNIDYAVNESEQITDNEITDYEEFEGYYWSPIFKDKTTPVVTYPLLEGDLVKGKYLKARLKATTDGNQQASISSVKLKYNNSNLT